MNVFLLILLMLAAGGVAWISERIHVNLPRWLSLLTFIGVTAWVGAVWLGGPDQSGLYANQFIEWIPRFGINLIFQIDGLSLLLIGLTAILGVAAVVSSWTETKQRTGFFQFNVLWVMTGVVGVFSSFDLLLFFFFWEVMLIPMYFLIAIWGHEDKEYAAMKFFLFTQISGLLMLVAIIALVWVNYEATNTLTFSYEALLGLELEGSTARLLMLGFFIAFVTKLPSVPVHTWLPDAHTQAPTAGSVILAGILLKTGAYGIIRFVITLFPEASQEFWFWGMLLGVISILYGGYLAYSQTDFKRLVAYSSIAHMGFVLVGVYSFTTIGMQGAIVTVIAHGFSTAALFMMAGALQERLHSREMSDMGGLWQKAPRMGAVTMFFVVASVGMPGLGNFIGEFLVLVGAFNKSIVLTVLATFGVVVAAVYGLSLMQRSFQGELNPQVSEMQDFGAREMSLMAVLMVALIWIGVHPQTILALSDGFVQILEVIP